MWSFLKGLQIKIPLRDANAIAGIALTDKSSSKTRFIAK